MRRTYRTEYERLLPLVEKPGRYLGTERGSVHKDLAKAAVRVALAFPDVYEIAQSHLGLQILYDVLNRRDDVAAERAYAPWPDLEELLRERGLPLVSLESHSPLEDFDVVGFSLQYELTYTNLLTMLELGGIPIRAADRGASAPIVIAGGPCAFNPEPLADFLDAVVLGDGEQAILDVVDVVRAWDRRDRSTLLRGLAAIPGVYVPSLFEPSYGPDGRLVAMRPKPGAPERVTKRVLPDLADSPIPTNPIVPNLGIVHDRASVEVMRGCVKGCRFCQAGYVYRPLRERDPRAVVEGTTELVARTGYDEVSLLSLSTGDYSGVNPVLKSLMDTLAPQRVAVSLPSTRVDALSPRILEEIRRVRKTGFTLAPEAGTQRLRDIIQKEYTEAELLDAARVFADLGWRALKLYFMIGLPSETEEDVRGIAILAERVRRAARGKLRVTASVSTFSPKPHTPFQWAASLDRADTEARQALLRRELGQRGIEFRWHDPTLTWLEGILARGDRRLGGVIAAAQRLGARFDGWSDHFRREIWDEALAAEGIDPSEHLRRRSLDEVLPWDHIDAGVSKKWLARELARAVEGTLTPDCSVERCTYCGACDFETLRNVDYHPEGAKGGEHRGARVSRWAEMLVPETPGDGLPEWETRTWRKIRTAVRAGHRTGRAPSPSPAETPLPAVLSDAPSQERRALPKGQGTAEEWLEAGRSALEPMVRDAIPAVQRIRLHYRKLADGRFIGTRELGTVFLRAARRATLPIAFSNGFHPLPRFSFGPALPLGATSDHELVDVELTARVTPSELVRRLRAELPSGLVPIAAWEIDRSTPSIDTSHDAIVWELDVAPLDAPIEPGRLRSSVTELLAADTFPVERIVKRRTRTIDARPLIRAAQVTPQGRIRLELSVGASGSIKPSLVVGALLSLPASQIPLIGVHKAGASFHPGAPTTALLGA